MRKRRKNPSTNKEYMECIVQELKEKLVPFAFAYVHGVVSTLGGIERPTILLTVSFDMKAQWKYGILENSRYAKISIDYTGKMEMFAGNIKPKLRKKTIKNVKEAIDTLYYWSEKVMNPSGEY